MTLDFWDDVGFLYTKNAYHHRISPTVGSACALAGHGLGIALVNELLAKHCLRPGTVMLPFEPRLLSEYAFVTSSLSAPTRLTAEFLRQTRRHFSVPDPD